MIKYELSSTMNRGSLRVKAVRDKILKSMMDSQRFGGEHLISNRKGKPYLTVIYLVKTGKWLIREYSKDGYFFVDCREAQKQRSEAKAIIATQVARGIARSSFNGHYKPSVIH